MGKQPGQFRHFVLFWSKSAALNQSVADWPNYILAKYIEYSVYWHMLTWYSGFNNFKVSSLPLLWRRTAASCSVLAREQPACWGKWSLPSIWHLWERTWSPVTSSGFHSTSWALTYHSQCRQGLPGWFKDWHTMCKERLGELQPPNDEKVQGRQGRHSLPLLRDKTCGSSHKLHCGNSD